MSVEQDLERIISQVGDIRDLPEYLRLRREGGLASGYRMRIMEPAGPIQTGVKHILGYAALAALTYFTATQAVEAYNHYTTINTALGDIQTTLHHVNVLNVPESGQHILNDLGTVRDNMLTGIVSGAKAAVGANLDIGVAAIYQPWRKPRRKGRIWGIA